MYKLGLYGAPAQFELQFQFENLSYLDINFVS